MPVPAPVTIATLPDAVIFVFSPRDLTCSHGAVRAEASNKGRAFVMRSSPGDAKRVAHRRAFHGNGSDELLASDGGGGGGHQRRRSEGRSWGRRRRQLSLGAPGHDRRDRR